MKRRYNHDEKAAILKEHFHSNVPVLKLAEKYEVSPSTIYSWMNPYKKKEEIKYTIFRDCRHYHGSYCTKLTAFQCGINNKCTFYEKREENEHE